VGGVPRGRPPARVRPSLPACENVWRPLEKQVASGLRPMVSNGVLCNLRPSMFSSLLLWASTFPLTKTEGH
jgi:hypothetical protein